jgi:aspartate-semialdehyde dehydrogenase
MSKGERKIEVGVLGATGMVGQQFVRLLAQHRWFELVWIGASDRSAGKSYADATSWRLDGEMPEQFRQLQVQECQPKNSAPRLLFSSMDASIASEIEQAFADVGHVVVSNSRNHRMEPDVPLLVPEINAEHLQLIPLQQRKRGWKGQIATNPNCSTVVLSMSLAPLKQFGIRRVMAATMQAISGAGYPGVASMDINANVIPFIAGEEEKMQQETQKILGDFSGGGIRPLDARVSASCHRVPVVDGHTVAVSVELERKPQVDELIAAIQGFQGVPQRKKLPSAPTHPLIYTEQPDRPQPRRDANREQGMAVTVGRLRPCPVLDFKYIALGHNTIRGAAGAAILNAELMVSEGLLD